MPSRSTNRVAPPSTTSADIKPPLPYPCRMKRTMLYTVGFEEEVDEGVFEDHIQSALTKGVTDKDPLPAMIGDVKVTQHKEQVTQKRSCKELCFLTRCIDVRAIGASSSVAFSHIGLHKTPKSIVSQYLSVHESLVSLT